MNEIHCLIYFLLLRLLTVFVVQTSYVPDEYWQSLEVSHFVVYGNGHLTWEWQTGLRSYTYPAIFTLLYRLLNSARIDNRNAIVTVPRIVQASFTAFGDLYTVRLCGRQFGTRTSKWAVFTLSTSWFLFYCASRTLTNTMEMTLTSIGLYYYHCLIERKEKTSWNLLKFLFVAGISVAVRPTAAIQWFPLCCFHLFLKRFENRTMVTYAAVGLSGVVLTTIVDRSFYGRLLCSVCNFVRFNVINDQGSIYGSHPWYWYWIQGFPVIMGPHLIPFMLEMRRSWRSPLLALVLWHISIYSFLSHKEFRFLLPIVPLSMCFVARYLSSNVKLVKDWKIWKFGFSFWVAVSLLMSNVPLTLYFAVIHQRGTLDSVDFLAKEQETHQNVSSICFLMPCHSTPLYSHLHHDIATTFLSCEPNLQGFEGYVDEADSFYLNPEPFLSIKYARSNDSELRFPSYIVMFDVLRPSISNFLERNNFSLRSEFFHSHFVEGRVGKYVQIYSR